MCVSCSKGKNSLTFQVYFESDLWGVINLKGLYVVVSTFQIRFPNFTTIMTARAAAD